MAWIEQVRQKQKNKTEKNCEKRAHIFIHPLLQLYTLSSIFNFHAYTCTQREKDISTADDAILYI